MKEAYPVILRKGEKFILASVPDFGIDTQGSDLAEAIEMARDAIGLNGIDMEDDKKPFPPASAIERIKAAPGELVTLVDVDFAEYRRRNSHRTVRRNVSLPGWLDAAAESAGINVSAVLQNALRNELGL